MISHGLSGFLRGEKWSDLKEHDKPDLCSEGEFFNIFFTLVSSKWPIIDRGITSVRFIFILIFLFMEREYEY